MIRYSSDGKQEYWNDDFMNDYNRSSFQYSIFPFLMRVFVVSLTMFQV
ncbi:MAG: hypothetical protein NTX22_13125 [Ignavibacteriales bacterium]|nr:hypothetical protein [Ignavibacteriales bacterium]